MRYLVLFLFLLPYTLLAQENESFLIRAKVKQGSILIGGTLSALAYSTTDQLSAPGVTLEGRRIHVIAKAKNGYFVMHDLAVGLDLTIEHQSIKVTDDAEQKPDNHTFALMGPFVRYYLDNGIFGELTATAGLNNFSLTDKYNLTEATAGIGYAYFIKENFSIEPTLSMRYFKQVLRGDKYTSVGPVFGVGIQAYLLRKKAHVIKRAL